MFIYYAIYGHANMLTGPTPAGMGTLSHTLTPELFVDLSDVPLLSSSRRREFVPRCSSIGLTTLPRRRSDTTLGLLVVVDTSLMNAVKTHAELLDRSCPPPPPDGTKRAQISLNLGRLVV